MKYRAHRSGEAGTIAKLLYALKGKDYKVVNVRAFSEDEVRGISMIDEDGVDIAEASRVLYGLDKGWKAVVVFESDKPDIMDDIGTGKSFKKSKGSKGGKKSSSKPSKSEPEVEDEVLAEETPREALKRLAKEHGKEKIKELLAEGEFHLTKSSSDEDIAEAVRYLTEKLSEEGGEEDDILF